MINTSLNINWKNFNNLIIEMKNNSKIKKAVFVYTKNKEFLCKFEGVTQAGKNLNIS